MNPPERLPFRQCADVHRTEKFVSVEPLSGYAMVQPETNGYVIYLQPDATDEQLGRALLEALDKSRFIWPPDEPEFFRWQRYTQCYEDRRKKFMERHAYKSERDLYKNMNWCRIRRSEGKVSIQPHQRRDTPGEWKWLPLEQDIVIAETRDAAVVGAALRLALDRCE